MSVDYTRSGGRRRILAGASIVLLAAVLSPARADDYNRIRNQIEDLVDEYNGNVEEINKIKQVKTLADQKAAPAKAAWEKAQEDEKAAEAAVAAAREDATAATKRVGEVVAAALAAFESSPEVAELKAKVEEHRKAMELERAKVLATLAERTDYKAAVKRQEDARNRMQELRTASGVTSADIQLASTALVDANKVVADLEKAALEKAPQYLKAQEQFTAANAELTKLTGEFKRKGVQEDSSVVAARQDVVEKQKAVGEANKSLADAKRAASKAKSEYGKAGFAAIQQEKKIEKIEKRQKEILEEIEDLKARW